MKSESHIDEDRQSLWLLTISPAIWAAHFLLSYLGASLACGAGLAITLVHTAVGAGTMLALAAIAFIGWQAWQRLNYGDEQAPHDADSPEDRHRFLGLATLLLSMLSAIAIIFATVSVFMVTTCA